MRLRNLNVSKIKKYTFGNIKKMEDLIELYVLLKVIFKKYEDAKNYYFENIANVKHYYHKYFSDLLTE